LDLKIFIVYEIHSHLMFVRLLDVLGGGILDGFCSFFKHEIHYTLLVDHQLTKVLPASQSDLEYLLLGLASFLAFNWRHVNFLVDISTQLAAFSLSLDVGQRVSEHFENVQVAQENAFESESMVESEPQAP